jgi:hypothetical protein
MKLDRFMEIMKGVRAMENEIRKKEIIIKGVKVEDTPYGPRIGICDMEGIWMNSSKSRWAKLPGTWEGLTSLKAGERVHIDYEVRPYTAKDGSQKSTNDIVGFEKIIQKEDEVKPVTAQKSFPGETPPPKSVVPETGARQTCLNCAVQIVAIWVDKEDSNHVDSVIAVAKQLYASLKESW